MNGHIPEVHEHFETAEAMLHEGYDAVFFVTLKDTLERTIQIVTSSKAITEILEEMVEENDGWYPHDARCGPNHFVFPDSAREEVERRVKVLASAA